MKAIFVTNYLWQYKRVYTKEIKEELSKLFELDDTCYDKEKLFKSDLKDVEIIFSTWYMPELSEEDIRKNLPSLKAIFYSAGTVKYFATPFLKLGIKVFSAWQANAVPVVEYSVSQILLATKGFFYLSNYAKKDYKTAHEIMNIFPGNYNTKIGILGYGAIGKNVVKELLRHKLDLYVFAPNLTFKEAAELKIHKAESLDEIFTNCDVISNHLANLPATVGMIDRDLIFKLKDYSTFINTGRGQQVDEIALVEKLESNPKISAVLDVTCPEPPVLNSRLFVLPNVTLTPHIAGSSGNEVVRMAEYMIEDTKNYLNNKECKYEITLDMLDSLA